MGLSMAERRAVTKELAKRYEKSTKKAKRVILDELCELTGWSRRHARRALSGGSPAASAKRKRPTAPRIYDEAVIAALRKIWALAGGPCGKRLAPFIATFVEALERHGELELDPVVRAKLLRMSAATMDRVLVAERKRLQVRGRHGTKPGTLLRHQIPVRTFAEWDDARPGFCEVDLVHHDDGAGVGEFFVTLNFTDVCSGWTEMRAVQNKAQRYVHAAIEDIASRLPMPLVGLDSDNGSEFINHQLFRWCTERKVTFTRTRPWRKNDNCFVEQKNWTHVRQMVGYARYDTPKELALLQNLYEVLRLWVNFFSPQQRLVSKTRNGAKVSRRYDIARTPYQRLLESPHITAETKRTLRAQYDGLNPAELSTQIGRLQRALVAATSAKSKTRRKEVSLSPPDHPWRRPNRRQPSLSTRTSEGEAMKARSRTS